MAEHQRRAHYSGKYPKKFEEKYKELNADKYEGIAEHVTAKGSTPAGMHISICVNEILEFLDIKPGQSGLDATLGYGGHTLHMLKALTGGLDADGKLIGEDVQAEAIATGSHLVGLDIDPIESKKTEARIREKGYGEDIWVLRNMNFRYIDKAAEEFGKFDFILADLGVSSMQIDDPSRGFSYKTDGPLDLRMNPSAGKSAAETLKAMHEDEIAGMLIENSDEPFAEEIAAAIISHYRKGGKIETTTDLRKLLEAVINHVSMKKVREVTGEMNGRESEIRKNLAKKTCARVFQALRIDVNSEFEVLYEFLEKLPTVMKPGGRIAILTFHSGEDRLVKQSFKQNLKDGVYSEIAGEPIRPSKEECVANSRAKSTKFRYAVMAE